MNDEIQVVTRDGIPVEKGITLTKEFLDGSDGYYVPTGGHAYIKITNTGISNFSSFISVASSTIFASSFISDFTLTSTG